MMKVFLILFFVAVINYQCKQENSLLGQWQVIRVYGITYGDYKYDSSDDRKGFIDFIDDSTVITNSNGKTETFSYKIIDDTLVIDKKQMKFQITNDSAIITGIHNERTNNPFKAIWLKVKNQ